MVRGGGADAAAAGCCRKACACECLCFMQIRSGAHERHTKRDTHTNNDDEFKTTEKITRVQLRGAFRSRVGHEIWPQPESLGHVLN